MAPGRGESVQGRSRIKTQEEVGESVLDEMRLVTMPVFLPDAEMAWLSMIWTLTGVFGCFSCALS